MINFDFSTFLSGRPTLPGAQERHPAPGAEGASPGRRNILLLARHCADVFPECLADRQRLPSHLLQLSVLFFHPRRLGPTRSKLCSKFFFVVFPGFMIRFFITAGNSPRQTIVLHVVTCSLLYFYCRLCKSSSRLRRFASCVQASHRCLIASWPWESTVCWWVLINVTSSLPPITYYLTVPLILDRSYFVGKLTSSKIADAKV